MILPVVAALRAYLAAWLRSRHSMLLEILALHHALTISRRSMPRLRIRLTDRLLTHGTC